MRTWIVYIILIFFISSCSKQSIEIPDYLVGNYFATDGEDFWKYSIQKDFLIEDCMFWDYLKVKTKENKHLVLLINNSKRAKIEITRLDSINYLFQDGSNNYLCSKDPATITRKPLNTPIQWKADTVLIRGYIKNFNMYSENEPVIKFIVNNFILRIQESYFANIDSLGRFQIGFPVINSTDILFKYHDKLKTIYVNPSDTLLIFLDPENMNNMHFMGSTSDVCYNINKLISGYYTLSSSKDDNYHLGKLPPEYRSYRESLSVKLLEYLDSCCSETNCSETFKLWMNKKSEYEYYDALLEYSWKNLLELRIDPYDPYYDFIDSINMYDTLGRITSTYAQFAGSLYQKFNHRDYLYDIDVYNRDKQQMEESFPKLNEYEIRSKLTRLRFDREIDSITTSPYSYFRDLRLCLAYSNLLTNGLNDLIDHGFDMVKTEIEYKPYLDELSLAYNEYKQKLKEFENTPVSFRKVKNSADQLLQSIVEKHKNKVIILDFWGTWCGACRDDFKRMTSIKKKLSEKEVVFVYLCYESLEDEMKDIIKAFQVQGDHYLLSDRQYGDFVELFNLSTAAPQYILIDKTGKVRNTNFIRPFDEYLYLAELNKIIKN